MKQFLLLFAFLLHIVFGLAQTTPAKTQFTTIQSAAKKQQAFPVYICEDGSTCAYYCSENCAGLNRCMHLNSAIN